MQRIWIGLLLCTTTATLSAEEIVLFNGKNMEGWTHFLQDKNASADKVWTIEEGTIKCTGKPTGYIRTEKAYENYILTLEWRFSPGSKGGNSGVLLHMTGEDKIWPKSIEAQLMAANAGDIWTIDGADVKVLDPTKRRNGRRTINLTDNSEKPIGEWNKYVIVCSGDTIALIVNGDLVNYGWKATQSKGYICLQSEGAPIEFRNIKLQTLE